MLAPVKEVVRHLRDAPSPPIVRSLTQIPQPEPDLSPASPAPWQDPAPQSELSPNSQNYAESAYQSPAHGLPDFAAPAGRASEGGPGHPVAQSGRSQHHTWPDAATDGHSQLPAQESPAHDGLPEEQQEQLAKQKFVIGAGIPSWRRSIKRAAGHLQGPEGQDGPALPDSPLSMQSAASTELSFSRQPSSATWPSRTQSKGTILAHCSPKVKEPLCLYTSLQVNVSPLRVHFHEHPRQPETLRLLTSSLGIGCRQCCAWPVRSRAP